MVKKINGSEFKSEVESGVTFVDFYADWCMPCKMLAPVVDIVSQSFEGKVKFLKLNIDEAPEIASQFGIMSIPTVIAFKNGQPAQKSVGLVDQKTLEDMLNKVI